MPGIYREQRRQSSRRCCSSLPWETVETLQRAFHLHWRRQKTSVPELSCTRAVIYQADTYPSGHTTSTSILTNLCIDTPTKSSSNRNKYYLCPTCPHRKLVRADTAMGKTGKCKCGAQLVLSSTAKSVIDEQIPEQLAEVGVSDSVS